MIRRPREKSDNHLKFVRALPCVVCGNNIETEAAHVRFASDRAGKRSVGIGEKPDDKWTVPLCGAHHREQHHIGERRFWAQYGISPISVAAFLWCATGNHDAGECIVRNTKIAASGHTP